MTEQPSAEHVVAEAFFAWNAQTDVDLVAHSFDRPADAQRWLGRLDHHVRLQPIGNGSVPAEALSYYEFDGGWAAVIRRVDVGQSRGRNHSHALVGPADVLTVPVALGLARWEYWLPEPPADRRMHRWSAADFADKAGSADRQFRPHLDRLEPALVAVLARILEQPGRPVSLIGFPPDDQLPLVWGLRAAAEDYLRQLGAAQRWSFSTYEERHDVQVENLPWIVFLPVRPSTGGAVQRNVIMYRDGSGVSTQALDHAQQLVSAVRHGTNPPEPRREPAPVAAREGGPGGAGGAGGPGGSLVNGPVTNVPFHGGAPLPSGPGGSGTRPPGSDGGLAAAPPTRTGPSVGRPFGQGGQAGQWDHPAVAKLRSATNTTQLMAALHEMEQDARGGAARENLRRALDPQTVLSLTQFVEHDLPESVYRRLTAVMFGENGRDLGARPALRYADEVMRTTRSDRLRRMVLATVPPVEEEPEEARARAARVPWAKRAWTAVSHNPMPTLIAAGVAVVALLLALWAGGVLFGAADPSTAGTGGTETAGAEPDASPTPGAASVPAAIPPQPGGGQDSTGQTGQRPEPGTVDLARLPADENATYYGFRLTPGADTYQPLRACRLAQTVTCERPQLTAQQQFVVYLVPNSDLKPVQDAALAGQPVASIGDNWRPVPGS